MMNRMVKKDFAQEIAAVIRTAKNGDRLPELLKHYHWRDVAKAITLLADAERERLFRQMDAQTLAEIFPYLDDASRYLAELPAELAAAVITDMDTADALDMLRELPAEKKQALAAHLDDDTRKDVRRLLAFHQEEIGSRMSGNFVCIPDTLTVCGAMNELVRQAGEHDNISTLYVVDGSGVFAGAIDLKDLIIARENDPLSGIIRRSYPYVLAHERVEDCIDRIAEYEEDSLPVLTEEDLEFQSLPYPYIGSRNRKLYNLWPNDEQAVIAVQKDPVAFTRWDNGEPSDKPLFVLPASEELPTTYNLYMGGDFGETILDTDRPELPNVLVFGDSFTNALETLLYASFNEMHSLDLRYYTEQSLKDYIAAYQPDLVLCVQNDTFYYTEGGNNAVWED